MSKTPKEFKMPEYKLEKPVEDCVLLEKVTPEITRVTLNRPERHNSIFAPDMFREIIRKMEMAADDEETKVVIIGGNGPSFCSGDDIRRVPWEVLGGQPGQRPPITRVLHGFRRIEADLCRTFVYHPKVIIAELHGWVIGIGFMLTLLSDLAIASDNTRLSHRVQRIAFGGLDVCVQPLIWLHMGIKKDREFAYTGRDMTVQELQECGLVNAVVPDKKLKEETMRWAESVALMPADGLAIAKAYNSLTLDMMGVTAGITSGYAYHALMTNLRWRPDEFNFLKVKGVEGFRGAVEARQARWEELGF
jgi:enoyl-CoA hydratase